MPEGDVVYRTAHRLDSALSGRVLMVSDFRWPSLATVDLRGRIVEQTVPRGKHLLTRISGGLTVHSHLRMEGSWHVVAAGRAFRSRSASGIRVVLGNDEWTCVGHRLGMLDVVATGEEHTLVGHLGPDILGPDWDADVASRNVQRKPERAIGAALLDQTNLAGIGTFFMSEALFLRGIDPWCPAGQVEDLPRLLTVTQRLMQSNLATVARGTNNVHGRARQPCTRCRTPIRVEPIGDAPTQRMAFYCPRCQRSDSGSG